MKKLIIGLVAFILLIILALVVVPSFLDPNRYKGEIEARFKESSGLTLALRGPVSLSLFPVPKATVSDVTVSNNSKTIASVNSIIAYPKLAGLLSGKFELESLEVTSPKIIIERTEGVYNWENAKNSPVSEPAAASSPSASGGKVDMAINSVKINDGNIQYRDENNEYKITGLNATASIGSLRGPVKFNADMNFDGENIALRGGVENFSDLTADIEGDFMGSKISYRGRQGDGKLSVSSPDISPLVQKFRIREIEHLGGKPVGFSADVTRHENIIALKNMDISLGETKGSGSLSVGEEETSGYTEITTNLKFQNLKLDDLLPPEGFQSKIPPEEKKSERENFREGIKKKTMAHVQFSTDRASYNKNVLNNLQFIATVDGDNIVLSPFNADIPGGGRLEVFGTISKDSNGRAFDGAIAGQGTDLRKLLETYQVDVGRAKPAVLKQYAFSSNIYTRLAEDKTTLNLTKADVSFDETRFSGNIEVVLAESANGSKQIPDIDLTGSIGKINFDDYLADSKPAPAAPVDPNRPQGVIEKQLNFDWLREFPVKGKANLNIGSIGFGGDIYSGVKLQTNFRPGEISIGSVVASGRKIQFSARGALMAGSERAKVVIEANLGQIDTANFISAEKQAADKAAAGTPKKKGKARWSTEPFDFKPLDELDVEFVINTPLLKHRELAIGNLIAKGVLDRGKLSLDRFDGNMFGGALRTKGNFDISSVPTFAVNFAADNMNLVEVAQKLADNNRLANGRTNISGSLTAGGVHQLAMIQNLEGAVTIAGSDIWVKGFDVDVFAQQLTNINSALNIVPLVKTVSDDSSVTKINVLKGSLLAGQGVVKPQNFQLQTKSGQGRYEGYADLVNWVMDTKAIFNLIMPDGKDRPGLGIRMSGDIDEPKIEVDSDEIRRYIERRLVNYLGKRNIIPQEVQGLIGGNTRSGGGQEADQETPAANDNKPPTKKEIKNELIKQGTQELLRGVLKQ